MRTLLLILFALFASCDYNYDDDEPVAPYEIRSIQMNGQQLDAHAIMAFDRLFGFKIKNGEYWVNDAGQWGYANSSNPAGTINFQALQQMQAEQGITQAQQPGSNARPSGGGLKSGRSVNGSVVSGRHKGKNCTVVTASGGMSIKTCN